MCARSLAEGDTLAFEVGDRLDRRVLGNDDRLIVAVRFDGGHVSYPRATGLRENRRGIADEAEVDSADIEGLEQRRTELEIHPLDLDAEWLEDVLDRVALPHRRKESALLRADADFSWLVLCLHTCWQYCKRCEGQHAGDDASSGSDHAFVLSDLIEPPAHDCECVLVCLPPSTALAARSASRAVRKSRPSRRSKARSEEKKVKPRSSPATIPAVRS